MGKEHEKQKQNWCSFVKQFFVYEICDYLAIAWIVPGGSSLSVKAQRKGLYSLQCYMFKNYHSIILLTNEMEHLSGLNTCMKVAKLIGTLHM